jgi:hypothetical protein
MIVVLSGEARSHESPDTIFILFGSSIIQKPPSLFGEYYEYSDLQQDAY